MRSFYPTVASAALFLALASAPLIAADGSRAYLDANPQARVLHNGIDGRISRVFGGPLSTGTSAEASVTNFINRHLGTLFNVKSADLVRRPTMDGLLMQPVMYDLATGTPRFFAFYFDQTIGGVPVYGSNLMLLVRNEPGFPLVLASSELHDPSGIIVNRGATLTPAGLRVPGYEITGEPRLVVFIHPDPALNFKPTLGYEVRVEKGTSSDPDNHEVWTMILDASTGAEMYRRSGIYHTDVNGSVKGYVTPGLKPDTASNTPVLADLFSARVDIVGGSFAYTNATGGFTIPNAGSAPVTVRSQMKLKFLTVFNEAGTEILVDQNVTPPGPADFVHNSSPTQYVTAQVNALYQTAIVHDWQEGLVPTFPGVNRTFRAYVNINSSCNAYYDGSSINFYRAAGGCANTAYSTVVHHEYGHKIVDDGNSPDPTGDYHEGMADCIAMVLSDSPITGQDFFGPGTYVRTADNNTQYPCNGESHFCGQVISGAVWHTRMEMVNTEPDAYLEILQNLTLNSVLLTPQRIDPGLTVDFLTLDDDDSTLLNGTPHYDEIATGFGRHNLDAPPAYDLYLQSTTLNWGQNATLSAELAAPGSTVRFYYSLQGTGSTFLPDYNVNLDLSSPVLAGSAIADANGEASFTRRLPNGRRPTVIWLQAAEPGEVSQVIVSQIN